MSSLFLDAIELVESKHCLQNKELFSDSERFENGQFDVQEIVCVLKGWLEPENSCSGIN